VLALHLLLMTYACLVRFITAVLKVLHLLPIAAAAAAADLTEACINKLIDQVRDEQHSQGQLSGPIMAVAIAVPIVVASELSAPHVM
jgi:hypothetical protein